MGGASRALTNLSNQTSVRVPEAAAACTRPGTHCWCPRQKERMLYGDVRWLTRIFSSRSAVMMYLSSGDVV